MPERIQRPERILWRPDEIEDFDEEFQSIIWIRDRIQDLSNLPKRCIREERLLLSLQASLGSEDDEVVRNLRKEVLTSSHVRMLESKIEELDRTIADLNHEAATWKNRKLDQDSQNHKVLAICLISALIGLVSLLISAR